MTGRPNFCLISRTRAVVSLPWICRMSGCSASIMFSKVASSASTVSATFTARPLAWRPSSRAVSSARCRGDGGKNTKPTMSAPASSATSSVSRVDRPQILTSRDMVPSDRKRLKFGRLTGRVLQRRALLVSPGGPVNTALRKRRIAPLAGGLAAQIGQLGPHLAGLGLMLTGRAAPAPLPEPGRHAAGQNAKHGHRDDHHEQRQRHRDRRRYRIEGVERDRHQMAVGDREDDEENAKRNDDQRGEEFSHDHLPSKSRPGRYAIFRGSGKTAARLPSQRKNA